MAEKKNYLNGIFIQTHKFTNGGEILKCGVKVDDFCKALQECAKENGWANIIIAQRREPSEKGHTHYVYEDTYQAQVQDNIRVDDVIDEIMKDDDESLPF